MLSHHGEEELYRRMQLQMLPKAFYALCEKSQATTRSLGVVFPLLQCMAAFLVQSGRVVIAKTPWAG